MAIRKSTRSNSTAQLHPQPNPQRSKLTTKHRTHPHHLETELFDTLRQFNQAFGTALCALERIDTRFSGPNGGRTAHAAARKGLRNSVRGVVRVYNTRIGELRAQVNRDLFRVLSGVEDHSAARFSRLQHSRA